jgi:serine/threonine protein phosphatase PrpC
MLTVFSATHPGAVRTTNEDASTWDPALSYLVVADGMGGHNAGEVASALAIEAVGEFLRRSGCRDDFTWPFGVNHNVSFGANRLTTAVKLANRRVHRASEERAQYTGMGTTITIALVEGSHVTFANVGDSRLYSMPGDRLQQLSRDDSWTFIVSRESGVDPSAFHNHPMRNVLTNVVGARAEIEVAIGEFELVDGQLILLCTDGLHGAVSDAQIEATLRATTDLGSAVEALVEAAVKQDGRDNVTVMLGRYTTPDSR